ncbi:MAG: hypothetical protein ACLVGL_11340 [Waltera sp.]
MVRLYTSGKYFKDNEIIIDNDSFLITMYLQKAFPKILLRSWKKLTMQSYWIRISGKIETPYGITGIQDLSTGCKTILNCIFLQENQKVYPTVRAINATECGKNALEQLFCYIDKTNMDIGIVLSMRMKYMNAVTESI